MSALLLATFQRLEEAEIQYCLLRDADQLERLDELTEVDLLVAGHQFQRLQQLLTQSGFVALPSWGHAPHHFFVIYHAGSDRWLKLDIVTEIAFGHPYHTLYTTLAGDCLARRQWQKGVFILSAECEVATLLLHCLLDKGRFDPHRAQRLQMLQREVKEKAYLTELLQLWGKPDLRWATIARMIEREEWDDLLALRGAIKRHLTQMQPVAYQTRQLSQRLLRKGSKLVKARNPQSISVAILAPDGAGKSTVVEGIQKSFYFPVYTTYMGLYQKGNKRGLASLLAKAGFGGRLLLQWQRYLTARVQQAQRKLVIFDRYSYDALLPSAKPLSRAQQWRRWLLGHSCPSPDLVIFLDAPGAVLYARKGEHSAAALEEQRQAYLALQSQLPQMVVIDATQPPDLVRRRVITQIWRTYLRRQLGNHTDDSVEKVIFDLCAQE